MIRHLLTPIRDILLMIGYNSMEFFQSRHIKYEAKIMSKLVCMVDGYYSVKEIVINLLLGQKKIICLGQRS